MRNRRVDAIGGAKPSEAAKLLVDTLKEKMDPRVRALLSGIIFAIE
jgi:hypothetical protein